LEKNYRVAPEVKEQMIKRIKEDGVPVSQAAKGHGIHEITVYG
jgi:transposase-like protein